MPHIEELATSNRAPAPGWSYVVETGPRYDPSKAAINPTAQKRRRITGPTSNTAALSGSASAADDSGANSDGNSGTGGVHTTGFDGFGRELTLRQKAEIKRHLADLERDGGHKEVAIPVPKSSRAGADGRKQSANVKRILGSGKTFAHYLEEEEAAARLHGGRVPKDDVVGSAGGASGTKEQRASKMPYARRKSGIESGSGSATPVPTSKAQDSPVTQQDKKPAVAANVLPQPTFAPGTVLAQPVPVAISEEEIEALISAPPLTYNEARSKPPEELLAGGTVRRRHRVFCEICGYWGRVRCMKCGARVCGIECRETHDESRCLKFYA